MLRFLLGALSAGVLGFPPLAPSQTSEPEFAKQLANPIASLMSVP